MKTFIIILVVLTSFAWGFIQPTLFPIEEYGWFCIVTALIGGTIIGMIGEFFYSEFDDD